MYYSLEYERIVGDSVQHEGFLFCFGKRAKTVGVVSLAKLYIRSLSDNARLINFRVISPDGKVVDLSSEYDFD